MTREEAIAYGESKKARIQERLRRAGSSYGDYAIYYSEMAFTSAALAALREQEERRWIPVSERKPEVGNVVLIYAKAYGEGICIDYYDGESFGYSCVTHWMPLPEPPEEDS